MSLSGAVSEKAEDQTRKQLLAEIWFHLTCCIAFESNFIALLGLQLYGLG